MKKYFYPAAVLIVFSSIYWSLPFYFESSETVQKLALNTRDLFFKIRRLSSAEPGILKEIVFVSIDDESCRKLNARWPWSRRTFAVMIDELAARGARLIGLNVSFAGLEDGSSESSQILAQALRTHGNVVVGATFDESNRLVGPSPLIAEAAARVGYLEKIMDADLSIRRSYLVRPYAVQKIAGPGGLTAANAGGFFESSFPLQLVAGYSDGLEKNNPGYDRVLGLVTVGNAPRRAVFLEPDGSYTINYLAAESDFLTIPAWKVVQGKVSGSEIRNKMVLIGLRSSLFSDMHSTPFGIMSGIGIHANELISILSGRMLRFVPDKVTETIAWLVGLCVLGLYLSRRFWLGIAGSVAAVGGVFIGSQLLFAQDMVMEPFTALFGPFFATLAGFFANSLQLLLENKGLETKVIHDKLTGLYKYEYLRECLEEEWKRCLRAKSPVSVVMTDLDRFKQVNDTLGHEVGNDMIKRAGKVIQESARRYDVVSRYGGDEFVILLWHSSLEEAKIYRERLRDMYHTMVKTLEPALQGSSISIGVASFDPAKNPRTPPHPQALIEEADKDLFLDKQSHRS